MFAVTVFQDQTLARTCIQSLKKFYSDPIVCFADGTQDEAFENFCKDQDVSYIEGSRLKLPRYRGAWTRRFMLEFLCTKEQILIKVDPDTVVNSHAVIPEAEAFGTIRNEWVLSGAAVGFRRSCVERIMLSGLLLDPIYETKFYYPRFYPPFLKPGETQSTEMISCQDEITTDVMRRLKIPYSDWPSVSLNNPNAPFFHKP